MKGLKARLLKKLRLIPTINALGKGLASHPNHPQQQQHTNLSTQNHHTTQPVYKDQDCKINNNNNTNLPEQVTVPNDQKGKETDLDQYFDVDKQDNINKPITPKIELKETFGEQHPSLQDFEEKCPPGGEDSVVLYTTSLRGIRKTFEDCRSIRYLISSFKILVHERDISMDMEFRDELWRLFGEKVVPPKLFIKGRYIGGADEVIGLHEEGMLRKLLEGIPLIQPNITCTACANMKFLVCPNCDGSRKVFAETEDDDDDEELCLQCPDCNENGLVKCTICCLKKCFN